MLSNTVTNRLRRRVMRNAVGWALCHRAISLKGHEQETIEVAVGAGLGAGQCDSSFAHSRINADLLRRATTLGREFCETLNSRALVTDSCRNCCSWSSSVDIDMLAFRWDEFIIAAGFDMHSSHWGFEDVDQRARKVTSIAVRPLDHACRDSKRSQEISSVERCTDESPSSSRRYERSSSNIADESRLSGRPPLIANAESCRSSASSMGEELTFLVAHYNLGQFIGDCVRSIRAQTNPNWQCLILDDGSTDGSFDDFAESPLVKGDTRFTILRSEENRGYIASLERLIAEAQTDIVGILDPDDAVTPDCVAKVLAEYRKGGRAFVYSNFAVCDINLRPFASGWCRALMPDESCVESDCISHFKTFRKSAYYLTEGLDTSILYAEDKDLVYKLEEVARPYFVNDVLYYFRTGRPDSQSSGEKGEIGRRNATRAKQNALRRRNAAKGALRTKETADRDWTAARTGVGVTELSQVESDQSIATGAGDKPASNTKPVPTCTTSLPARNPSRRGNQCRIEQLTDRPADQRFDEIECGRYLEAVIDPSAALKRCRARLTAAGNLTARFANLQNHRVISTLVGGHWRPSAAEGCANGPPIKFFTRREIEKLFYRSGFEITQLRSHQTDPTLSQKIAAGEVRMGPLHVTGLSPFEASDYYATEFQVRAVPRKRPKRGLTSIVILTHNELPYTHRCLESIRRRTDEPYEIIVVDNASTDGTLDYVSALPDVQVIANAENRGFAAGCNQGIKVASGDQVLLLNNDTIVTTGWLDRMLSALESDERIGLVGPTTNNCAGDQRISVPYDNLSSIDGFAWDWGSKHRGELAEIGDNGTLIGFCLLIRRSVIERVGVLDEQFGVGNFEDNDYCERTRRAGYRLVIARDSFVHHFGGVTFRGANIDYGRLMAENERRYSDKWGNVSMERGNTPHAQKSHDERCSGDSSGPFTLTQSKSGSLLLSPREPRISLCMIVRDSAATLDNCIASIAPWVDEMIVVDTGSKDDTVEIARRHGAKVSFFEWCKDFAAARNESLKHATGDWIFWMDSDDTIDEHNGRQLRELVRRPIDEYTLGFVIQVHCPGPERSGHRDVTAVDHVKLFRNLDELRFEGRIHEQILASIRRVGGSVAFTDLFVVHSGVDHSLAAVEKKQQRDLELIKLDLKDRPGHPFVLFNLGMTYADMAEYEDAAKAMMQCLEVSDPQSSHVRKAYAIWVGVLMELERSEQACEVCKQGRDLYPDDPELLYRHAILEYERGNLEQCVVLYEGLLRGETERHFSSIDRGIFEYKARHNLALAYFELEKWDKATELWRHVIASVPAHEDAWRGLGRLYLRSGNAVAARELLSQLAAERRHPAYAMELTAALELAGGNPDRARLILADAVRQFPDRLDTADAYCQLLFEQGPLTLALDALTSLAARRPDDGSVLHNLATVHLRLGMNEQAVNLFQQALELRPESSESRLYLGYALRNLSRVDEAIENWRIVDANASTSQNGRQAREELAAIAENEQ